MNKNDTTVQTPAKIISTQKTHRQPALLETILGTERSDKCIVAIIQRTHKPATVGPSAGPRKMDVKRKLEAGTRVAASHISAMTPPELFNGAHAKNPARKRVTSNVGMF
jgi:hypothetical protein